MRIAICEDELEMAKIIKEKISLILKRMGIRHIVDVYCNGNDLLDDYSKQYDVLFIDICLHEINGFDVAKNIRKNDNRVIIVFLTSFTDYAFEGYKLNIYRYLLKQKFNDEIEDLLISLSKAVKSQQKYIIIKSKPGYKKVFYDDILYLTSYLRKVYIFTEKNTECYYGKLSDIEDDLLNCNFIRTHQSYLVNYKYIKTITLDGIQLFNNTFIPVSKRYAQEVKKKVLGCLK